MKYSQQQLKDINRRYANINRSVKLTNQRANGIQSIIVDQVIPEDLLDARNQNDIENDEFAKRALLNKYSREILGTGDIYDFQKKLIDSGIEKTFLNQFPEVLKESKNFRKPTVNNVINITQRIYNKNIHELNLLSSNKRRQENNDNLLAILEVISDNLGQLIQLYPRQQNQIQDQLNRVDATITTAQTVDDPDSFFGSLFGNDSADVADGLNQIAQITDPNQIDPNSQVAPVIDPVGILAGISQSGLTEALESASSNISSAKSRTKREKVIEFDPL
jgi:protein-tyrosine-phosphatase